MNFQDGSARRFPSVDEYQELIQDPGSFFVDPDLQARSVETDRMGLPRGLSGGFVITYAMASAGSRKAVRCFKFENSKRERVYGAISARLRELAGNPYFVDFEFQPDGLRYKGQHLPCLKMDWVEGETLSEYVRRRGDDPSIYPSLRAKFAKLQDDLEQWGIAHGDLQGDNVIVSPDGSLKLIDYDGLYVQGLSSADASEVGLPAYQHPERSQRQFGNRIDRFSFIVLDVTFAILAADPSLRKRFPAGDQALLFDGSDYLDPMESSRIAAAIRLDGISSLVQRFALICLSPMAEVPTVRDFREGKNIPTGRRVVDHSAGARRKSEIDDIAKATFSAAGGGAPPVSPDRVKPGSSDRWKQYGAAVLALAFVMFGVYEASKLMPTANTPPVVPAPTASPGPDYTGLAGAALCRSALNGGQSDWDTSSRYADHVKEAQRRGYSIRSCQILVAAGATPTPTTTPSPSAAPSRYHAELTSLELCRGALNSRQDDWDGASMYVDHVREAKRRGFSVPSCRDVVATAQPTPTPTPTSNPIVAAMTNTELCVAALNGNHTDWEQGASYVDHVREARRRGFSIETCRSHLVTAQPPAALAPPTADFTISNSTSSELNVVFFDASSSQIDPVPGRVYSHRGNSTQSYRVNCERGARVCYGATMSGSTLNRYWGLSVNGRQTCSDCCIECGATASTTLSTSNSKQPTPTVTWTIVDNTRTALAVAFYSQSRSGHGWPGWDQHWPLGDRSNTYTLTCLAGEKICYGAWDINNTYSGKYWGVGPYSRHGCTNCCLTCDGGSHTFTLTD